MCTIERVTESLVWNSCLWAQINTEIKQLQGAPKTALKTASGFGEKDKKQNTVLKNRKL